MSASNGTKAAHNPCTRYNPLSSDNNTAGQQTLMNYPPQRKNDGLATVSYTHLTLPTIR